MPIANRTIERPRSSFTVTMAASLVSELESREDDRADHRHEEQNGRQLERQQIVPEHRHRHGGNEDSRRLESRTSVRRLARLAPTTIVVGEARRAGRSAFPRSSRSTSMMTKRKSTMTPPA
jgi:hypothetical protein